MHNYLYAIALSLLCACEFYDADAPDPGAHGALASPTEPRPGTAAPAAPPEALLRPDAVESVEDVLPGTWFQPFALPGQISLITLGAMDAGGGDYSLYRSCGVPNCIGEAGRYHAVPENPAIGFAFITLLADEGTLPATYLLDLYWRNAAGEVIAVQARRLLPNDAIGAPFLLWRLPEPADLAGEKPAASAPAAPAPVDPNAAALTPGTLLDNVAGVYVRTVPIAGDIGALTLGPPSFDDDGVAGSYEAAFPYCLPWCFPETGNYELSLFNPFTGSGLLRLGERRYLVVAIWRDLGGQVTGMQLQRLGVGGVPIGPVFTMYRQWWIDSPTESGEVAGACGYYQGLAQYFQIRALQCGMGACWPLTPIYAYWAQYYAELAAQTCPQT